jgi:hypothetical protein
LLPKATEAATEAADPVAAVAVDGEVVAEA